MDYGEDFSNFFAGDDYIDPSEAVEVSQEEKEEHVDGKGIGDLFKDQVENALKKRKPIPQRGKLNERSLIDPMGLDLLRKEFATFKPNQSTDPYETLEVCLKKYQHWASIAAPRMKFEDVVERCEQLGHKRLVSVTMDRMRLTEQNGRAKEMNQVDLMEEKDGKENAPMEGDEFCQEPQRSPPSSRDPSEDSPAKSSMFNGKLESATQEPSSRESLTEEQRKRVAENRLRALELRAKKLEEERRKREESMESIENTNEITLQVTNNDDLLDEDQVMAQFDFE